MRSVINFSLHISNSRLKLAGFDFQYLILCFACTSRCHHILVKTTQYFFLENCFTQHQRKLEMFMYCKLQICPFSRFLVLRVLYKQVTNQQSTQQYVHQGPLQICRKHSILTVYTNSIYLCKTIGKTILGISKVRAWSNFTFAMPQCKT